MIGSIIILYSVEKPIFDRARERLDWIRERLDWINPRVEVEVNLELFAKLLLNFKYAYA